MAVKRNLDQTNDDDLLWLFSDCLSDEIPEFPGYDSDDEKAVTNLLAEGIYISELFTFHFLRLNLQRGTVSRTNY